MKISAEITLPRAQLEALSDADLRWLEAEFSRRFEEELRRRIIADIAADIKGAPGPRPRGLIPYNAG